MKKILKLTLAAGLIIGILTGCGSKGGDTITVLTREEGSGTRGAFIELLGIEKKDADGKKTDRTIAGAETTNSTSVMITTVEGNKNAIGYISLGSLDENKVKALRIDGAAATADNVKSGEYKVSRPFNLAAKGDVSDIADDFIKFILSENGQTVIEERGYISQGNSGKYTASNKSGKITVGGSSSIAPVMEKLKEAYIALNPDVQIEIQQNDSTSGMTGTIDGIYDIGMASREVKESEKESGLVPTVIALDGIAVIVNKNNETEEITADEIMKIYTGEITSWSEIVK